MIARARGPLLDLRGFRSYATGLPGFLSQRLTEPEACRRIGRNLDAREERFLALLRGAVLDNGRSPYRRLLAHAGIETGDLTALVAGEGVEAALSRLHDAGVWLSLEEARGERPVRRGSLELQIEAADLHNPLLRRNFSARSGGSRSAGSAFWIDLRDVEEASAYPAIARRGFGLERSEGALWLPTPPGVAGIRRALWWSKAGMDLRRWFAQTTPRWRPGEMKRAAFLEWTIRASRRAGRPLPRPERTPPAAAPEVAAWVSQAARAGRPVVLFCTPSSGARVCSAAADAGLDIEGTFFSLGGEAYTAAKARAVGLAGCRAEASYYVSELGGPVAVGCPHPGAGGAMHLAEDRIALIERERDLAGGGAVSAFHLTTVTPFAPRVAINLEVGDYGVKGRADCGCRFAEAGLTRTVSSVRSYEKLSTEGMHFLGPRLLNLLEEVLPHRFGGIASDYQLIEEEDPKGRSRVILAVSPRIGDLDDLEVRDLALAFLGDGDAAGAMMAEVWSGARTLAVVRREPVVSKAGKVLPLHVAKASLL